MVSTAIGTLPLSYSKVCDTFRPRVRKASATRTDLGGKRFVHFLKPCAMPNGLVRKHVTEGRPARIENGLCHAGLGKSGRVHVAHGDMIKLTHDAMRKLVQKIVSPVGDFGVDFRGLALFLGTLRLGKFFLQRPIVPGVVDLLPSGERGELFQAEINSDAGENFTHLSVGNLNHDVQVPVSPAILRKICAILDLAFRQRARMEHAKGVPGEAEGVALALEVSSFERNPAERLLATIAKVRPLLLRSGFGVLLTNRIHGTGVESKLPAATGRKLVQVEAGRPPLAPLESVFLGVVAEIPNVVARPGLPVEQAVQGFYAVAVNLDHGLRFSRNSSMARRINSATGNPVSSDSCLRAAMVFSGKNTCVRFMPTILPRNIAAIKHPAGVPAIPPRPERRGLSRRNR